jgi:dTMP kinase
MSPCCAGIFPRWNRPRLFGCIDDGWGGIVRGVQRGLFITFEGNEGCGKSTQIQRLAERLRGMGVPVTLTREPGGTEIGEEIKHLLQFNKKGRAMVPEAELLLFTASRAQLVRELVGPALAAGTTVIADRFHDSTTVYQGVARAIDAAKVDFINGFAVGMCLPDVTFVLDVDLDTARARMLSRKPAPVQDRMEQQPAEFYAAVREGYLALARRERGRVHLVDASLGVEEVEACIWNILREKMHGLPA